MTHISLWRLILRRITPFAPSAHIAGGAVRDMILERPVKDIDVFLPEAVSPTKLDEALDGLYSRATINSCDEYVYWNSEVGQTGELLPVDVTLPPLNLIWLKSKASLDENLTRFDFGLCRAAYSLDRGLVASPEFVEDAAAHRFTVTCWRNAAQVHRTLERYRRIGAKYQGWPLVLPPEAVDVLMDDQAEDFHA